MIFLKTEETRQDLFDGVKNGLLSFLSNWGKDDEGVIEERKFALFYFFAELEAKPTKKKPRFRYVARNNQRICKMNTNLYAKIWSV